MSDLKPMCGAHHPDLGEAVRCSRDADHRFNCMAASPADPEVSLSWHTDHHSRALTALWLLVEALEADADVQAMRSGLPEWGWIYDHALEMKGLLAVELELRERKTSHGTEGR